MRVTDGRPAGPTTRLARLALACLALLSATGAGCPQMIDQATGYAPRVLPPNPTQEQVIAAVNNHTARVNTLYCRQAAITSSWTPPLRASLAVERPARVRLLAETALSGPLADLGSNDAEFWFGSRLPAPALYFCRHDQYAASAVRRLVPVEPLWLIEALGLTGFAPYEQHQGPFAVGAGRLEMRTLRETPDGPLHKITLIEASRAWVLEQHLYDARGQLLASVRASDHRHDPVQLVTLPRHIELSAPAAQVNVTLDLHDLEINTLTANDAHLWQRPYYEGWAEIDLADPNVQLAAPPPVAVPSAAVPPGGLQPRRAAGQGPSAHDWRERLGW